MFYIAMLLCAGAPPAIPLEAGMVARSEIEGMDEGVTAIPLEAVTGGIRMTNVELAAIPFMEAAMSGR